jgi:hypothetical protein
LISDRDFQIWLDWMLADRELSPGQLAPSQLYTNALNAEGSAPERAVSASQP